MRRSQKLVVGLCFVLIAAASANAAFFATRGGGGRETAADVAVVSRSSVSRPYLVAPGCGQSPAVQEACRLAIRYLRALDRDRFQAACGLLARETLDNAGGMKRCVTTLASARGVRIRYGIHAAVETALGTSIHFRTKATAGSGPGTEQTMIVRSEQGEPRIWAVMAEP